MSGSPAIRRLVRGIGPLAMTALLAALIMLILPLPAAHASELVVDTDADNAALTACTAAAADCSLRGAISRANADPGVDTITFAAATNGLPILLAGAIGDDLNANGDLDIWGSGDLTIQGNGAANTIIDGGSNDRVLHVCPGGGCTTSLTLAGVTVRNGRATGGTGTGGGILNAAGTTTLKGSNVSANTADYGGGIYTHLAATLNIQNGSTIGGAGEGNTAIANGGGIFSSAGAVTVDGSTISANTAQKGGGVFNWEEGTLNITNSTVGSTGASNMATHDGGGIFNEYSGTATVDGTTISTNTATDGGGIYNKGTLHVRNGSTIGGAGAGNEATTQDGGGIYNGASGTVTVDGSTIDDNFANSTGGGIYNLGTLLVQKGSAIGEIGTGNGAGGSAGGLANGVGGLATVDGSAVSGNNAHTAGGIYNLGTLTVTVSTISSNGALSSGGGIQNQGTLTISGSTIGGADRGNVVQHNSGGGVYNGVSGKITVEGSTVSANRVIGSGGCGGGIYNRGTLAVAASIIGEAGAGNEAGYTGGGISNEAGGSITLKGSTISANSTGLGGGIFNAGTLAVSDSTIGGQGSGNSATVRGGGIHNGAGTTVVTGSCILHNWATLDGGSVHNDAIAYYAVQVTGSSIAGNRDVSFLNDQVTQQNATGNWWGAATGPNTPGADTVGGLVDTGGYLTTTILACNPELQVGKANDTGGSGAMGTPFHWTLTIANTGVLDAVFAKGQRILVDDLPAGATYGSPTAGGFEAITNSANIDCSITDHTLTCQATGAEVTLGATTGRFEVVFSVRPRAGGVLRNPTGKCRVDPDGHVTETDEGNNSCPTDVVNVSSWSVYLPLVLR